MITSLEAIAIAKKFSSELGEVVPGIFYGIGQPQEYKDYYYFDFWLVDKNGNIPKDLPEFAGAPGITISKQSGEAQIISFAQFVSLTSQ